MDIGFWVGIAATVMSAVYAAFGYHRPPAPGGTMPSSSTRRRDLLMRWLPPAIAVCAVGFDYFSRCAEVNREAEIKSTIVQGYGVQPYGINEGYAFLAQVDTKPIMDQSKYKKLLLIVRISYANIDRMSDKFIKKSQAYSFSGDPISMGVVGLDGLKVQMNKPLLVEFDIVLIPASVSPDQVSTLSDVETLGGQILVYPGTVATFVPPASPTNSPAAPLPAPRPPLRPGKT